MGAEIALIFGSIPCISWTFLAPLRGKAAVFCADGGVLCARAAGFAPDVYIGDGDSGGTPPEGAEAVLLPPEKDLTDLQAAYQCARDRGYRRMALTACTGGRQDHHLSNLLLLETAWREGVAVSVLDPWNEIFYTDGGELEIPHGDFRYFSIVPADRTLQDVRITGAKYPLDAPLVRRGDSLTVSNETVDGPARIRIGSGAAWIVRSERI